MYVHRDITIHAINHRAAEIAQNILSDGAWWRMLYT